MTKQQENRAFAKMLKEFPKAFGRVSFRERLMLRVAFTYVVEEVIGDIRANFDYVLEGKDLEIKTLGERCIQLLKDKGNLTDENKVLLQNLEDTEIVNKALEQRIKVLKKEREQLKGIKEVAVLIKANNSTVVTLMELNNRLVSANQQIEEMKMCCNCDWSNYLPNGNCLDCDGKKNWKLKEVKENG